MPSIPKPASEPAVPLLPRPKGDVDKVLLEHVKRAKSGTVSWAALYVTYRAWCLAVGATPVEAKDFGAHLDALRSDPQSQGAYRGTGCAVRWAEARELIIERRKRVAH